MEIGEGQRLSVRVTERIRDLLYEHNEMSQRELARLVGRSPSWVQDRFKAKQAYDLNDIELIADALKVRPEDLLGVPVLTTQDPFIPLELQQLSQEFTAKVAPHYLREGVSAGARRALLRIVREALKYVDLAVQYWLNELERARTQPAPRKTRREGGGRASR